jgi:hypothetical protein
VEHTPVAEPPQSGISTAAVALMTEGTNIVIDYEHRHIDTISKIRCGIDFIRCYISS